MRLKSYITEMSKEIKTVRNIISPMIPLFFQYLQEKDWEIDDKELVEILNILFGKSKPPINFELSNEDGGGYKNIIGGDFNIEGTKVGVNIYLSKNVSKFFEQYKDPNKEKEFKDFRKNGFISDLENMISHELRHLGQLKSSNLKIQFIDPEDAAGYVKYLSSDSEIDAFSYQAAIEYLKTGKHGESYELYKTIFNPDKKTIKDKGNKESKNFQLWLKSKDKTYKKFLKKYERYKKKLKDMKLDKIF